MKVSPQGTPRWESTTLKAARMIRIQIQGHSECPPCWHLVVVKTVLGSHFGGPGEFTAHFGTYFSGWIGMFSGGTIWVLTHGHMAPPRATVGQRNLLGNPLSAALFFSFLRGGGNGGGILRNSNINFEPQQGELREDGPWSFWGGVPV